jgi:hypothetical protein
MNEIQSSSFINRLGTFKVPLFVSEWFIQSLKYTYFRRLNINQVINIKSILSVINLFS